jgi:hypothetical protein
MRRRIFGHGPAGLVVGLALLLLSPSPAHAVSDDDRVNVGGYFRVMTRPDLQGGNGKLGHWNLYGRLLNEGPWAALELRLHLMEQKAGSNAPWTLFHTKVEGGSIGNADPAGGSLDNLRLSQAYIQSGNLLLDHVVWQLGTLDSYFGDLGLYDMRPAQIFFETMGLSARYDRDFLELLLGVGDSGYFLRGSDYSTVLTLGGTARVRLFGYAELGVGGQLLHEPQVQGNRFAPYTTPGIDYEDFVRGEVVERYLEENPGQQDLFPDPEPTASTSFKAVGYVGFGNLGPLVWNNLFLNYGRRHPDNFVTEVFEGQAHDLYIHDLTDQRYALTVGNEMQFTLWPGRLDAVWGALYGSAWDEDNSIAPSDYNQDFMSTVLRLQAYLTDTLHLLAETSVAQETSKNGNRFRNHRDSIFVGTAGQTDAQGLEFGDADARHTWQGKTGVVLNPLGPGIYLRPSLRLLYGVQYSTENLAYGNSFVQTLDQYEDFGSVESHWHHVIALEAEAWF